MVDPNGLLMIEPSSRVSPEPVVDALTRSMAAAWRERRHADATNGFHLCACGARSDSNVWRVGGEPGWLTNSLCMHYLAYHRDEVPAVELEKVRALNAGEAEPTPEDLRPPPPKRAERLARVPQDLRDWLAGIRTRGSQHETALDAFLNNGAVRRRSILRVCWSPRKHSSTSANDWRMSGILQKAWSARCWWRSNHPKVA